MSSTTKHKKRNEWTFNLRTRYVSDDSQSDSETDDQKLATANAGTSGLLIDDLDLSKREENVAYKPNPFSIAKINASYRPSTVNGSSSRLALPVNSADKPTQPTTKPISRNSNPTTKPVADKPNPFSIAKTNAAYRSRYPSSTVNDSSFRLAQPVKPTDMPTQLTTNLNPDPTARKPVVEKPVVSVPPANSTFSKATSLSTSAILTSPCSVSATMIPNTSGSSSASSRIPENAHIFPSESSQHHSMQTSSKISQSRVFAPAQPLPDMFHNQRKTANNHRPVFPPFSSPGHPYGNSSLDCDPRTLYSQTYSSPIQPTCKSPFRPYPTLAQPSLKQTSGRNFLPPTLPQQSMGRSFLPPFSKYSDGKKDFLWGNASKHSSPFIKIEDQSEELKLVGDCVNQAPSDSLSHPPAFPSTSQLLHPTNFLNRHQCPEARPASLLPPPSFISSITPNPSNPLAKRQIPDAKSYPKRQFPIEDSDEMWTTLPSKKKRKPNIVMPRHPTYTQSFRLGLAQIVNTETIVTSAGRRVKVYLPPPLTSVDARRPTANRNPESKRTGPSMKEMGSSSPTNFDVNAYPSPSTSSSKPSLPFTSQATRAENHSPRFRYEVPAVSPYRPPSPPTSDLPVPSDAIDVHVEVDHEGIQVRYPEIKRLSRKRRRLSAEVWNLLGVDSCGSVWKDVDGEQGEIQIAMWRGLPPE